MDRPHAFERGLSDFNAIQNRRFTLPIGPFLTIGSAMTRLDDLKR
jgi:hypothetical protein